MQNEPYIWRCDLQPQYEKYKAEIDIAIEKVLHSGRYTLGGQVENFEARFAAYLGCRYAVGVGNATDGLILAMQSLEIGPGDEVITTPFTAIPTGAAIVCAGARPVFVDIDPDTFLIDIARIPEYITPRTKAILPVHLFGNVVDIEQLREQVPAHIAIIEDAAQSHGSTIAGTQSGTLGDLGVFSFYPTKNLGGYGDGGMVVTERKDLADRLKLLRNYGLVDKDHIVLNGCNSRLDELQAAVLSVKLEHLDDMNRARNHIAQRYLQELRHLDLVPQHLAEGVVSNYHVFSVRMTTGRSELMHHLEKAGIQTNVYYELPLHLQQANAYLNYHKGAMPAAEALCREIIALPMYPELPQHYQSRVIQAVNAF